MIGAFFGSLIRAAVSRQREFLADASAVQFTRNPEGISGALKRIGGFSAGSKIQSSQAGDYSHFFFSSALSSMFATHPPLPLRIRRIEPNWSNQYPNTDQILESTEAASELTSGFAGDAPAESITQSQQASARRVSTEASGNSRESFLQSFEGPKDKQIQHARNLLEQIPQKSACLRQRALPIQMHSIFSFARLEGLIGLQRTDSTDPRENRSNDQ